MLCKKEYVYVLKKKKKQNLWCWNCTGTVGIIVVGKDFGSPMCFRKKGSCNKHRHVTIVVSLTAYFAIRKVLRMCFKSSRLNKCFIKETEYVAWLVFTDKISNIKLIWWLGCTIYNSNKHIYSVIGNLKNMYMLFHHYFPSPNTYEETYGVSVLHR